MNDLQALVKQARECGATFILEKDRVRVRSAEPLPPHLLEALRLKKAEVKEYLAGVESSLAHRGDCLLEEWRRISIPDWRRILQESREKGDSRREEYARWMLREILEDTDYQEGNHD